MANYIKEMLSAVKNEFPCDSMIEVSGNNELLVQGSKGVIEYTDYLVRINLLKRQINVSGSKLVIGCLTADSVTVKGFIDKIEWVG